MKLEELRKGNLPDNISQLTKSNYDFFWISDFLNGPISGILLLKQKYYWFEMIKENDKYSKNVWFRKYAVIKLTTEQLKKELQICKDFQRYVGNNLNDRIDKKASEIEERNVNKFYEKYGDYCKSKRFEKNDVVAWLEL